MTDSQKPGSTPDDTAADQKAADSFSVGKDYRLLTLGEIVQSGDEYLHNGAWLLIPLRWVGEALNAKLWTVRRRRDRSEKEDDAAQWRQWRLLEVGEVTRAGDECMHDGVWHDVVVGRYRLNDHHVPHRRRRAPTIQHCDLPAAVESLTERVARLEAVTPPRETATASRSGVNADCLRTERVTLEVTHGHSFSAAMWNWRGMLSGSFNSGESVRVVEVEEATDIDRLTAERDAARAAQLITSKITADRYAQAVTEADAARAECERLRLELRIAGDHCTRLVAERDASLDDADALRTRVAEVEGERDAARAECERLRAQNALLWEAIGLATTSVPSLAIDADDPVGMMRRVVARKAELEGAKAANAGEKATCCTLMLNEYQVANLRSLIQACGYPAADSVRSPLWVANTGDWLGEIYNRLPKVDYRPNVDHLELAKRADEAARWAALDENAGGVSSQSTISGAGKSTETGTQEPVKWDEDSRPTPGSGDVFRDVGCGSIDDEIVRLTAERDSARAEASRQNDRVDQLERALKIALPANSGEDSNQPSISGTGTQEPVGYGVRTEWGQFRAGLYTSPRAPANLERGDEVVPLYAAPPEPRGWMTAEEREALGWMCNIPWPPRSSGPDVAAPLRALLARSTPPRVKKPGPWTIIGVPGDGSLVARTPMIDAILSRRDDEWIAAIREAGVEVQDG